ncbi:hypothetical protein [Campylobacter curvus]|uniref:hypothetical protein n=1 Tax=Campylobacter curvus TaxID=200 RepID=UPI0019D04812|nr:hypothetical protein [Campylobacter curvus]MBN7287895.1 hypothetical protein [Campylobacter curvus]
MEICNICLGNGWAIESVKNANLGKSAEFKIFAQFEALNNDITWIYDIVAPSDETINECKRIAMFNKACKFVVCDLDEKGDEWIKKEDFNGTFIDALEYIKENFKV